MTPAEKTLRVALVQDSPVFGDLPTSTAKAVGLAEEAAGKGAQLICFGETWLPGYPAWLDFCPNAALWNNADVKEVFADMRANSVVVGGPETLLLAETARRLEATIVIGVSERVAAGAGQATHQVALKTGNFRSHSASDKRNERCFRFS